MRNLSRYSALGMLAGAAVAAGVLFGALGWLQPQRPVEFSALLFVAIFTAAFARRQSASDEWPAMPPAFVIDFTSLLLFGPHRGSARRSRIGRGPWPGGSAASLFIPANDRQRHGRHARDPGRRARARGARWNARPVRVADAGAPDRCGGRSVLLRQDRLDRGRRSRCAPGSRSPARGRDACSWSVPSISSAPDSRSPLPN